MRLAHCSDIHQLSLRGAGPHHFVGKRVTGGLNLLLNRRRKYGGLLFEQLLERVTDPALALDRLVITGDLSNLALDSEFAPIAERLHELPLPVTVIPGNHDAYTRGAHRRQRFEHYFAPFMAGERESGHRYPFVWRADDVALIGVSSAIPSAPLMAVGAVGDDQLERLDRALAAHGDARRVVLIHHPPSLEHSGPRRRLLDAPALQDVLARRGAELVLHGHEHLQLEYELPGPGQPVPVHAISAAISISSDPARTGAFAVYDLAQPGVDRQLWRWDGEDYQPVE